MCPQAKILGCCLPWTKYPLAILPLTEPSHPFDLILCVGRACIRRRGANPINLLRGVGEAGQTPHWSIRRRRPTEAAIAPTELVPCLTRSRVGTHRSGTQCPRDALLQGRNIQEFSVGDTSVGDTSTLHHGELKGGEGYNIPESYYDPPEGHPGQHAYTFLICILSTSLSSISISSVSCYSSVSISMVLHLNEVFTESGKIKWNWKIKNNFLEM